MDRKSRVLWAVGLSLACAPPRPSDQWIDSGPGRAVQSLLAADRAFAAAANGRAALDAVARALAPDVVIPASAGRFARGTSEAVEVLRPLLGSEGARVRWSPIGGGISADGQHGFTLGYMTLTKPDTAEAWCKYLAYWVRRPEGWRITAYNVRQRPPGAPPIAMLTLSLPPKMVRMRNDPRRLSELQDGLRAAERAFSDRAQVIGLGPAFVEKGRHDAVHMGGANDPSFIVGNVAIGRSIGARSPQPTSPVSWRADWALVASSGDLGVTFGVIRSNRAPAAEDGPGFSFFTIWRRHSTSDPWLYIAE